MKTTVSEQHQLQRLQLKEQQLLMLPLQRLAQCLMQQRHIVQRLSPEVMIYLQMNTVLYD